MLTPSCVLSSFFSSIDQQITTVAIMQPLDHVLPLDDVLAFTPASHQRKSSANGNVATTMFTAVFAALLCINLIFLVAPPGGDTPERQRPHHTL
jgi:hypothetical protein